MKTQTSGKGKHLTKIAKELGVTDKVFEDFDAIVSNFFDQCKGATGINNGTINNNINKEGDDSALESENERFKLENEKLVLEVKCLRLEKEKAELEALYLREKYESRQ